MNQRKGELLWQLPGKQNKQRGTNKRKGLLNKREPTKEKDCSTKEKDSISCISCIKSIGVGTNKDKGADCNNKEGVGIGVKSNKEEGASCINQNTKTKKKLVPWNNNERTATSHAAKMTSTHNDHARMTQQKAIRHVQAHQTIEEKRQLEESSDTESEKSKDEVNPEIQHRIHETEKHHP